MRNSFFPAGRLIGLLPLLTALLTPLAVWSQATFPTPLLTSLYPLGGKVGSTVEITLKGTDLDGPTGLVFSPTLAVATQPKLDAKGQAVPNTLLLNLPAEAAAGTYEVRFTGTYGISNPRVFQVSSSEIADSPGTNSKPETALKIKANIAIHGLFKTAAPHWFEFEGQANQRLLATFSGETFATRTRLIGSLYDANGREIARLREGLLDVKLPAAGLYRLKVNDLMYGVGDLYTYRLTLTTGPLVWAAQSSSSPPLEVYGWNLPGGQLIPDLHVSPGPPLERLTGESSALAALIASSALHPLPLPAGIEAPTASPPPAPTPLQIGQTHSGWFPRNGDSCSFDLTFKAGDRFVIQVESSQLGFPTDPVLLVENVKKDAAGVEALTVQADVNDAPALVPAPAVRITVLDPFYAYEAKADGQFRLSVSDPMNSANGRRYPYTLRINRADHVSQNDALVMHPTLPRAAPVGPVEIGSANLWRGGISAIEVALPQRHLLSPPLELTLADLPPGVTSLGGFIGKGQRVGYLAVQATADAPSGSTLLHALKQTAHLNWTARDSNREHLFTRVGGPPAIGVVSQPAPARVEAGQGAVVEVAAGAKVEIPIKAHRNAAFSDALTLKVLGLGDVTKAPTVAIAAKANDAKLTLDTKALALAPGEYGFILQGPAKMPLRRNLEAIAAADLAAKKASAAQATAKQELTAATTALKAIAPENAEGLKAAQTQVKSATAKLAQADKTQATTVKAAKDLAAKNPPKDATFVVYSNPIRLLVKEAPKK